MAWNAVSQQARTGKGLRHQQLATHGREPSLAALWPGSCSELSLTKAAQRQREKKPGAKECAWAVARPGLWGHWWDRLTPATESLLTGHLSGLPCCPAQSLALAHAEINEADVVTFRTWWVGCGTATVF